MKPKRFFKWVGLALTLPIGLFFLTAILIYLPPIQNWIKNAVTESLSEEMNMKISVGHLRLAFPLDFVLDKTLAIEGRDTIVAAEAVRLDVRLLPLLKGKVELNALELHGAQMDTKSIISDTRIIGKIGLLGVVKPASADLKHQLADVNRCLLRNSNLQVLLSDTGKVDTTTSEPTQWKIRVGLADFKNTHLFLRMPGDSMRIDAHLEGFRMDEGMFDIAKNDYRVQSLSIHKSDINYDIPYAANCKGFDVNHIAINDLTLRLDTVHYADGRITMAIRRLMMKEKCGLSVGGMCAAVTYDSTGLQIPRICFRTSDSHLSAKIQLPWNALKSGTKEQMNVVVNGIIGKKDISLFATEDLKAYAEIPTSDGLEIAVDAHGNMDDLNVRKAIVKMSPYLEMDAKGRLQALVNDGQRSGGLHYSIKTGKGLPLNKILPKDVADVVSIPNNLNLTGTADFKGDCYSTDALLKIGKGRLSIKGSYALKSETYNARINAQQFPVYAFLPKDSMSDLTAQIDAKGRGFDFFSNKTQLSAKADIQRFRYGTMPLDSILLNAEMNKGDMKGSLNASNRMIHANMNLTGKIVGEKMTTSLNGTLDDLCMRYLIPENDTLHIGTILNINAYMSKDGKQMGTDGIIDKVRLTTPSRDFTAKYGLNFDFDTAEDSTSARISAGDLKLRMDVNQAVTDIAGTMGTFVDTLLNQVKAAQINEPLLNAMLPDMNFNLISGKNNPLINTLSFMGYEMDSAYVDLHTSEGKGLNGDMEVFSLKTGDLLLEKTKAHIYQDSTGTQLNCDIINQNKKNPNKFRAYLKGNLNVDGGSVETTYYDEKNQEGLNLGLHAQMTKDGDVTFRLFPEVSTIAYRKFTINKDNFITFSKDSCIKANVNLLADDKTGLKIDTPEGDSVREITISLNNVNLQELTHVLPFMPQLGGMLSGDVHANWETKKITAAGTVNVEDFYYENAPLGNITSELLYVPNSETEHYVAANLSRNNQEIMNVEGTYMTDGSDSISAEANLTHFSADMLNGFMGDDGTLALSGFLDGSIDISGKLSKMELNGKLTPDSLCVLSPAYGMTMRVEDKPLYIKDSKVLMDNIRLFAEQNNPLSVSGNVDLTDMSNVRMDLGFKGKRFQIVNSPRTKQSVVFGNVFVDLDATLKGNTSFMIIQGDLKVLDNTNVTYIMKDSPLTVEDRLEGLVEFVDFSDTTTVQEEKQTLSGILMNMNIHVSDATKLHCEFSADGSSYFNCEGGGNLAMRYTPSGEITLNGRFSMNNGEMKYALPFIPLKTFKLDEDSYISFTGDPYNPTLNITAKETMNVAVNNDGESSRMVKFNVGVAITQTLNDMGLEFLIEAPEDIRVQNDLASISKEERGKLAVSMLATGAYLMASNKSAFKATNALNAFLQSEIQNLAGNALKSVDFSVDVAGNTTAQGNYRTDYSFQFAKHLWNDRVTFRIGGKVSSGKDERNEGESFIDNISIEYRLGNSTTRNLRLFYENNKQDPLEGRYTSAGGGFVWRKKMDSLSELFLSRPTKSQKSQKVKESKSQKETR